jgi:hypothetical protein
MWSDEDIEAATNAFLAEMWRQHHENQGNASDVGTGIRAALNAVQRWRLWSEMPAPQVGDKVWAYSRAEGVTVLTYDHPIHEDFDGPDEDEPPQWWMDGEDVSGPEWQITHWMPYRVPEPPTND